MYELLFTFAGVSVVSINKTDMTDKILDTKVIAAQRQVKSAAHISEPYGDPSCQVLKCFMLPLCMSVSVKPPFVASGISVYLVFFAHSSSKQLIVKSYFQCMYMYP